MVVYSTQSDELLMEQMEDVDLLMYRACIVPDGYTSGGVTDFGVFSVNTRLTEVVN